MPTRFLFLFFFFFLRVSFSVCLSLSLSVSKPLFSFSSFFFFFFSSFFVIKKNTAADAITGAGAGVGGQQPAPADIPLDRLFVPCLIALDVALVSN